VQGGGARGCGERVLGADVLRKRAYQLVHARL
jgi:hypothetical protein